jgi:hypothetical protein
VNKPRRTADEVLQRGDTHGWHPPPTLRVRVLRQQVIAPEHVQLTVKRHVLGVGLSQRTDSSKRKGESPRPHHPGFAFVANVGEEGAERFLRERYGTL